MGHVGDWMFALPEPVQTVDVDEHVLRHTASVLARVVVPILHQFNLKVKRVILQAIINPIF
jgi:hypothetical protein